MDVTARAAQQASRYCYKCGKSDLQVSFRSDNARRCTACDKRARDGHKKYQRIYSKARFAATQRLIDAYEDDYEALLEEELDRRRGPDGSLSIENPEEKLVFGLVEKAS